MRILVLNGLFILFTALAFAENGNPDPARFTDCIDIIKDFPKKSTLIHRCYDNKHSRMVVIKAIANKEKLRKIFLNEIEIYSLVSDVHGVVNFYEQMEDANWLYVVMEYCEAGDFFRLICQNKNGFSEIEAKVYFNQLAVTLTALHDKKIAHLDIKSENFFLTFDKILRSYVLKIGDFGLSENLLSKEPKRERKGTENTMAPEIFDMNKDIYDPFKADTYSLGIFLFTLIFGHPPYEMPTLKDKYYVYVKSYGWKLIIEAYNRKRSFQHRSLSYDAIDLMVKLLSFDPKTRLSMKQVLAHPWLKN